MADITLQIVVQPPSMACQGTILDPPLAVKMGITAAVNGYSTDLNRVWAFATLIDEYDEVVNDKLQGTLADSAHSFSGGDSSTGYFLFDNLSIESVGSFRIRVTLMRMDNGSSGAASVQQIESDTIVVEEQEVPRQSPILSNNSSIRCPIDVRSPVDNLLWRQQLQQYESCYSITSGNSQQEPWAAPKTAQLKENVEKSLLA